jgi:hypothetical protein
MAATFYGHTIAFMDERHEGLFGIVKLCITEREGKEPITLYLRRGEAKDIARALNQDVRRIDAEAHAYNMRKEA